MTKKKESLDEHGHITIYDRGYGWIPELLRRELKAKKEIPFFIDAKVALLTREGATRDDVIKGLKALLAHLSAKWDRDIEIVEE